MHLWKCHQPFLIYSLSILNIKLTLESNVSDGNHWSKKRVGWYHQEAEPPQESSPQGCISKGIPFTFRNNDKVFFYFNMINVRWEQGNIHLRSCFRRSNWQRTLTRLRGIFQSYLASILQFWLLFYRVLKEASFKCSRHWWERSRECSTLRWVHRGRVFLSQVFYL